MLEVADKVIDGVKAVRKLAKQIENLELQTRIADLMNDAADLKMEVAELKSQISQLREENQRLTRASDLRSKMVARDRVLHLTEDVPGYDRGPFCAMCFETSGKLFKVFKGITGCWACPYCGKPA